MTCDVCGFQLTQWTDSDLETTLVAAPHLAEGVLRGATVDLTDVLLPIASLPREGVDAEAVHIAMHALHLAGRLRHQGTPSTTGTVVQVNAGGGGVPKAPVDGATLTFGGLVGDRQDDRRNHGRPWQAVCLWSAEVIEGLQAEGHPIAFGCAGENVTIRGLDWGSLSPGLRLQAGTAVLQLTSYAIPCAKNAGWFTDGGFRRMSHEVRPAGSRLYASVVVEGTVDAGDPVVVEPEAGG